MEEIFNKSKVISKAGGNPLKHSWSEIARHTWFYWCGLGICQMYKCTADVEDPE